VAVLKQRLGSGWRSALVIVQPETVLRWHHEGFRAYWRWKSQPRGGRPRVDRETRELIVRLQRENPLWGAPRNHGELLMLGIDVCESTVSKYLRKLPRPPSQTWRTRVLDSYVVYYNRARTHLSLAKDAPAGRLSSSRKGGAVVAFSEVGGLHHRYERLAA
jgi:hypothetical protein